MGAKTVAGYSNLSQIALGIVPVIEVSRRSKLMSLSRPANSEGTVPLIKMFIPTSSALKSVRLPSSEGRVPSKLFAAR
jgi:hypothetical protein